MSERDTNYLLSDYIEIDDCYFGGPSKDGKSGRGTRKAKVIVAASTSSDGKARYAKMKVVERLDHDTVHEFASANITKGSHIKSDGLSTGQNM